MELVKGFSLEEIFGRLELRATQGVTDCNVLLSEQVLRCPRAVAKMWPKVTVSVVVL